MKNEKGKRPVVNPFNSKLSFTTGIIDPKILVIKEIIKKIKNTT
jgi:hypothetical protein